MLSKYDANFNKYDAKFKIEYYYGYEIGGVKEVE